LGWHTDGVQQQNLLQVSPSFNIDNTIILQPVFFPLLIRAIRMPLQGYDNVVCVTWGKKLLNSLVNKIHAF